MINFQEIVYMIDYSLNTKRKRHITGGILLSIASLFAGLALTTITARKEDDSDE